MKGLHGLILAVGLGIAAALFNWAYLINRARETEKVYFVGVKKDVTINNGDPIKAEQIEPVGIPLNAAGNLKDFCVPYEIATEPDRQSVVGVSISRTIPQGGRLLLKDDLKTPRPELKLEPGEEAMFVPIDIRSIVTSLIQPGDMVMFLVPRSVPGVPTPVTAPRPTNENEPVPDASLSPEPGSKPNPVALDKIGPFKVLSVGNRLGSVDVMKSARIQQQQENIITVSVKPNNEEKALLLQSRLDATNFRQVGIRLLPRSN